MSTPLVWPSDEEGVESYGDLFTPEEEAQINEDAYAYAASVEAGIDGLYTYEHAHEDDCPDECE